MARGFNTSADAGQQWAVFDEMLSAVSSEHDVRGLFQQVAALIGRVVPYDEAELVVRGQEEAEYRYAITSDGAVEVSTGEGLDSPDLVEPQLLDIKPGRDGGQRHGLRVPVRIQDRVEGVLALFSRTPHGYSAADLVQAQRLANCLGHGLAWQRIAEQAREAAIDRQRSDEIENSVELLRTISGVLDIRTVFPRVSEIATKMLPHDALAMVFVNQDRYFVRQAVYPEDFPDPPAIKATSALPNERVISDLSVGPLPAFDPPDGFAPVIAAGYRSFLGVRVPARAQFMELAFWSKRAGAYTPQHLPVARRIADHVALSISHEQLIAAERDAAEARSRAERLEARVQLLSDELESKTQIRVVGESAEWRDVLRKATQVAETETTVLVTGESGTGKEVVARFIHRASPRGRGPFVALNCGALPEQLLESELFGYERGAFTSAQQAKPGHIEIASGGVLFLDEVTEMSLTAQAKLLRVLQEREFQRLGGIRILKANIRVIAATNRDLGKAVERGDFREDLYYRLKVFDIAIPPLRERVADILPLADALLKEIGRSFARPPAGLTRDAREALLRYPWPGNVRELRNALERAAILCEGGLIALNHLALEAAGKPPGARGTDLGTLERETIARVLRECRWNRTRAARRLGLTRTQLYLRLQKYGLQKPPDV